MSFEIKEEASQEESDQQNSSDDEVSFSCVFFFKWKVVWTDANRREAGFLLTTTLNSINWVGETELLPRVPLFLPTLFLPRNVLHANFTHFCDLIFSRETNQQSFGETIQLIKLLNQK